MNVTTFGGLSAPRENTRYIQGQYYLIGDPTVEGSGECYLIGDRYFRDTDYIVYDHFYKKYAINNESLIYGVIDIDGEDLKFGRFSLVSGVNTVLYIINKDGSYPLMRESLCEGNCFYRLSLSTGNYIHYKLKTVKELTRIRKVTSSMKANLHYNVDNVLEDAVRKYNSFEPDEIDANVKEVSRYLKHYTFGLEFETSAGVVPIRKCIKDGLIPLRDGSVGGLEYATIPLKGEKGLQSLSNIVDSLDRFTEYDESCSLHIHIGGIPRTEAFCLAMFKTMYYLQDEIFSMFPLYKKYNFGHKSKLYTAPLPNHLIGSIDGSIKTDEEITRNFGKLFKYLSMGMSYANYRNSLNRVHSHPNDSESNRKWQVRTRYHFFNLIPLIFTNKQTVEFRIHTPTHDKGKVMNHLLLSTIIVDFVVNNVSKILQTEEVGIFDLVGIIYQNMNGPDNNVLNELISYVNKRKNFTEMSNRVGKSFYKESEFDYNSALWGGIEHSTRSRLLRSSLSEALRNINRHAAREGGRRSAQIEGETRWAEPTHVSVGREATTHVSFDESTRDALIAASDAALNNTPIEMSEDNDE